MTQPVHAVLEVGTKSVRTGEWIPSAPRMRSAVAVVPSVKLRTSLSIVLSNWTDLKLF